MSSLPDGDNGIGEQETREHGDVEIQVDDYHDVSSELPTGEEESPSPQSQESRLSKDNDAVAENFHAEEEVVSQQRSGNRGSVVSVIGGGLGSVLPRLADHSSLQMPSSNVRLRHAHIRVFEKANSQFILEETTKRDEHGRVQGTEVNVKYANGATSGLKILRFCYGLVATFAFGFLFIFCVMLLLFLFVDLANRLGLGDRSQVIVGFIGVLLSIPVFVYGLSSGMAMAASFVKDTWQGSSFLRTFGNWNVVITEWVSFFVYIGIPLLTMTITLFARSPDWWAISLLVWFASILLFFGFFAACLLFYDISACLFLIESVEDPFYGAVEPGRWWIFSLMRRAILLRQVERFAGTKKVSYTLAGKLDTTEDDFSRGREGSSESMGLYTRMTRHNCCGKVFQPLDPPQRNYSLEEVLGFSPFTTAQSWSLEKIYCRNRKRGRQVAIVHGPSALTPQQVKSSFACAIIGSFLAIILPLALLVWMDFGSILIVIVILLLLLCCIPNFRSNRRLYKKYKEITKVVEENATTKGSTRGSVASQAIYQVYELYRLNRPSPAFCYAVLGVELFFLFLWPLIFLFGSGNWPIAILFTCVGFFSLVRHYLNASVVLKELGTFGELGSKNVFGVNLTKSKHMDKGTDKKWKAKSRLSAIVTNVSRGRARTGFTWIFAIIVLVVFVLFFAAVGTGTNTEPEESAQNFNALPDFYYEERPNIPYQTCQMGKGMEIPGSNDTAMVDYAFIAAVTYAGDDTTQRLFDDYFGKGNALNNPDVVGTFKQTSPDYVNSPAQYKYITITDQPDFGLVSVRGTSNPWDILADAQLWGTAALMQGLRAVLPIGGVFTPILHRVVNYVAILESANIAKVSYYKEISAFIRYLNATGLASDIHVTGHSLGGGLALISGAQTKTSAIGLSAPNAMLSRETFDPPLTPLDLNTYTFNIIPNRDVVPMVDDVADLYQRIECRTGANDFLGCHAASRSLCEIMWTCGSGIRPALCICAAKYGYAEPLYKGSDNVTFAEACANATYGSS